MRLGDRSKHSVFSTKRLGVDRNTVYCIKKLREVQLILHQDQTACPLNDTHKWHVTCLSLTCVTCLSLLLQLAPHKSCMEILCVTFTSFTCVSCSLRTSEILYLQESFVFYDAIRARFYLKDVAAAGRSTETPTNLCLDAGGYFVIRRHK